MIETREKVKNLKNGPFRYVWEISMSYIVQPVIPTPVYFGYIIDTTCLHRSENCGQQGACEIYDIEKLCGPTRGSIRPVIHPIAPFGPALVPVSPGPSNRYFLAPGI